MVFRDPIDFSHTRAIPLILPVFLGAVTNLENTCFFVFFSSLKPLQSERSAAGEVTTHGGGPESEKSP